MIGFRGYARLSALAIVLISWKETLYPRRWTSSDLLYCIPVLICALIASVPTRKIDFRARITAGFYIGLGFLFVINDIRSLTDDELIQIALRSLVCLTACTVIFATVTHLTSRLIGGRRRKWEYCWKCGYCLFGLAEPRCPECGTAIPKDQGEKLLAMQTTRTAPPAERESS